MTGMGFVGVGAGCKELRRETSRVCGNRRGVVTWNARPGPGGAGRGAGKGEGKAPSDEDFAKTITKVIEASFRKVWITLLTQGVGQPYEMALQAFILAVMAAYKKGFNLPALQMELSMNKLKFTDDEKLQEALELRDDEKKTRYIWMVLVYMVLQKLNFPSVTKQEDVPADEMTPSLKVLVTEVTDAYLSGFSFDGLKMEMALNKKPETPELTQDAASIRSQWMRIAYLTNKLVASNEANRDNKKGPN